MSVWVPSHSAMRGQMPRVGVPPKSSVGPQVTLHLDVHPPVLDTTGMKQVPANCRRGPEPGGISKKSSGRQFWSSLCSSMHSLWGASPVTWVNPQMVPPNQPFVCREPFYPDAPQYIGMDPVGVQSQNGLWFPAPEGSGSQFDYMDPLQYNYIDPQQVLQQKSYFPYNFLPPTQPYLQSLYNKKTPKFGQPLNPEAEEWVPSSFKSSKPSMPKSSTTMSSVDCKLKVDGKHGDGTDPVDFDLITEKEILAVREDTKDSQIQNQCNQVVKISKTPPIDAKEVDNKTSKPFPNNIKIVNETQISRNQVKGDFTPSLSYASAVEKAASPPPKPSAIRDELKEKKKCGIVEQPIPKIFLKDKKYPKEKAVPVAKASRSEVKPFKTPTKHQKRRSRSFLKELQRSSPGLESVCSDSTFGSPSFDVCEKFPVMAEETSVGSRTETSLNMQDSPVVGSPASQRTVSESSSNTSRIRSASESSIASVESVDIEFGEDKLSAVCDIPKVCILQNICQPKCDQQQKKYPSVLDRILGFDVDSEDSDEESEDSDDSDWDTVQADDTSGLDDSWETFIFPTVPLITKSIPVIENNCKIEVCANVNLGNLNCDISVEDDDNTSREETLEEINKRWEMESSYCGGESTPKRISFGDVTIRPMVAWSFAYRDSRKGPWEQYARDRARFSNRIATLEPIISPILSFEHRESVFRKFGAKDQAS